MALPVHPISAYPQQIMHYGPPAGTSGMLTPDLLHAIDQYGGQMLAEPLRGWNALKGTVKKLFGIDLTYTSKHDTYRSYEVQEVTFRIRYEKVSYDVYVQTPSSKRKACDDGYYRLLSGFATAACPGSSNHGWGLAIDMARGTAPSNAKYIGNEGDPLVEWLKEHVIDFGFSFETQSETWHIRWVMGNVIPAAVLAWENPNGPPASGTLKTRAYLL